VTILKCHRRSDSNGQRLRQVGDETNDAEVEVAAAVDVGISALACARDPAELLGE